MQKFYYVYILVDITTETHHYTVIYGVIVRLHFITARQTSPPVAQSFFRRVNPRIRGMACQDVKKAVSKTDSLLKSGGV